MLKTSRSAVMSAAGHCCCAALPVPQAANSWRATRQATQPSPKPSDARQRWLPGPAAGLRRHGAPLQQLGRPLSYHDGRGARLRPCARTLPSALCHLPSAGCIGQSLRLPDWQRSRQGAPACRAASPAAEQWTCSCCLEGEPPGMTGMTEASTTRRASTPCTRSSPSTTAPLRGSAPMAQVPTTALPECRYCLM